MIEATPEARRESTDLPQTLRRNPLEIPLNISVERLTLQDIRAYNDLVHRVLRNSELIPLEDSKKLAKERTENYYKNQLKNFDVMILVAKERGKIVGGMEVQMKFEEDSEPYGYVEWIGVDPNKQGKKIGKKLYDKYDREIKSRGITLTAAYIADKNKPAQAFALKMGYDMTNPIRSEERDKEKRKESGAYYTRSTKIPNVA
ncbi:MAG TPA: GNAT family N-acetyltransferase [Patescibacteria group bacterium]|nr:GNAT family N-acetyltransferase [Patescibacteria group bacterium]